MSTERFEVKDPKLEAEIELRRTKAIEMRVEGFSYREIAKELGVSVATAFNDVEAVIERNKQEANENADKARRIAIQRIDVAVRGLMPDVRAGNARSAEVMAKLEERRAKLVGLDAPEKRELTGAEGAPLIASPEAAARAVRELFGQHASQAEPTDPEPTGEQ